MTKHHNYADGGCLNQEPIANNELARQADVASSTASAFFEKEFRGHAKYRGVHSEKVFMVMSTDLPLELELVAQEA